MAEDLVALRKQVAAGRLPRVSFEVAPGARKPKIGPGSMANQGAQLRAVANAVRYAPRGIADLAVRLPKAVANYAKTHTPRQALSDVKNVVATEAERFRDDPGNAIADWTPLVGDVKSVREMADLSAELRAAGQTDAAEQLESYMLPAAIAGFIPEVGALAVKGAKGAVRAARPVYDRAVDGPFTVVARRGVENDIRTAPEAAQVNSMAALHRIAMDPARSPASDIANRASLAVRGRPYDFDAPKPVSSLRRQAGIGRAYQAAAEDAPGYKHATFERIGEMMPQVVEQAKAQNLDQLTEAAYRQLGNEVSQQFDQLPLRMRYHDGAGEYSSPNAMMRDVLGNGNLNVFSGGEPHEFLSRIDPATGLSQNEMFRAVHDYMGHVVPGSMFGAPGEEVAYAAHSQTLSPLAQLALLSETRGQNSWVNYSPQNADVIAQMNLLKAQERERKHAESWLAKYPEDRWSGDVQKALGGLPSFEEMRARRHDLGQQFTYAPQRAVLLPPEYLDPMSEGGVPDWLQSVLSSKAPSNDVRGVHFSRSDELSGTDPAYYGTGAFSGERAMVRREGLPDRTYFYSGPEGSVVPEESVGRVAKHAYEGRLNNLYDLQRDPEGLVKLAKAYNLGDYKPAVPEYLSMLSGVEPSSSLPDIERLVGDYGYSGFLTDMGRQRAAAVYDPVQGLRRIGKTGNGYAAGGRVNRC